MNASKNQKLSGVSKAGSYERIGEFWDEHSLDDHWDETCEVEFEVRAKKQHRVVVDPEVFVQLEKEARVQGVGPEKLLNQWLSEKLGLAK